MILGALEGWLFAAGGASVLDELLWPGCRPAARVGEVESEPGGPGGLRRHGMVSPTTWSRETRWGSSLGLHLGWSALLPPTHPGLLGARPSKVEKPVQAGQDGPHDGPISRRPGSVEGGHARSGQY